MSYCIRCREEHSAVKVQGPVELWACSCPHSGYTALSGTPEGAEHLLDVMPLKLPARASQSNTKKTKQKKG